MPGPFIYAELLSNIRQISVIATLDTPCDASTDANLSPKGREVILHHRGDTTSLNLPGQAAPNYQLQKPAPGSKELSWRLPLIGHVSRPTADNVTSNEAPWPAKDLEKEAEFSCRCCGEVLLAKGMIESWRDLPSENWAEMMDFWHCHKPDVPETNGTHSHVGHSHIKDSNANRGYGANTKFTAQSGVGFVDLTTFLVAESCCSGVETKIPEDKDSRYPGLICSRCKNYVGHVDHQAEGYRLYKWRLKSSVTSATPSYYEPSLPSMITAQLQSIMLAQCCSRLLFLPMNWKLSSQNSQISSIFLSMWILSPTIRYSSTAQEGQHSSAPGINAMKIFWKSISTAEVNRLMDTSTYEEIFLPIETTLEIETCLRKSALFLPFTGRKFQDWEVGLLERYDVEG